MRQAHLGKPFFCRNVTQDERSEQATRSLTAGRAWKAEEDELVRTLRIAEAAKQIGRTVPAVKNRRVMLGLPDGRTKAVRERRA